MLRPPKDTIGNLRESCICTKCPSYAECARNAKTKFFCIDGKPPCSLERYGCICGQCPVHKSKGFTEYYFCIMGKAKSK